MKSYKEISEAFGRLNSDVHNTISQLEMERDELAVKFAGLKTAAQLLIEQYDQCSSVNLNRILALRAALNDHLQ